MTRKTLQERFEEKFVRGAEDECWEWIGWKNKNKYPTFYKPSRGTIGAHVMSWELANNKEVPRHMNICHTCDNRICVNPRHLICATPKYNTLDSVAKGRHYEAAKTHCEHGHEYKPETTYVHPVNGGRVCKICAAIRHSGKYNPVGKGGVMLQRTHCKNGHEFNDQNTRIHSRGYRQCKICENARNKKCRESKIK